MPKLKTIMQTEHDESGAPIDVQMDEDGRLYVNGKRVATELDLGQARIPIWMTAIAASIAAAASTAQAVAAWVMICR